MFSEQPESDSNSSEDEEESQSRESIRSSNEQARSVEDAAAPRPWGRHVPTCAVPGQFVAAGYPMSYRPRILYHPTFESYYAAMAALQKTETLQMQIQREQGFPVNNGEYFYTDPLQPPGHRVYNFLSPASYNMFGLFRLVTPPPIVSPGIFVPSIEGSQTSAKPEDPNPARIANQEGTLKSSEMDFSVESTPEKFTSTSSEAVDTPKNSEGTLDSQGSTFKPVWPSRSRRSLLEPASTSGSRSCLIQPVCPSVSGRSLLEPVYSSESRRNLLAPVCPSGSGRSLIEPVLPSRNVRGLLKPLFTLGSGRSLPESACTVESGRSLLESAFSVESGRSLPESACSVESGRSLPESACSEESGRSLLESAFFEESGRSPLESAFFEESGRSPLESAFSEETGRSLPELACPVESGRSLPESACPAETGRSLPESACPAESGRSLPQSPCTHSVIHGNGPYTLSELEAVSGLLHLSGSYPPSGGQ